MKKNKTRALISSENAVTRQSLIDNGKIMAFEFNTDGRDNLFRGVYEFPYDSSDYKMPVDEWKQKVNEKAYKLYDCTCQMCGVKQSQGMNVVAESTDSLAYAGAINMNISGTDDRNYLKLPSMEIGWRQNVHSASQQVPDECVAVLYCNACFLYRYRKAFKFSNYGDYNLLLRTTQTELTPYDVVNMQRRGSKAIYNLATPVFYFQGNNMDSELFTKHFKTIKETEVDDLERVVRHILDGVSLEEIKKAVGFGIQKMTMHDAIKKAHGANERFFFGIKNWDGKTMPYDFVTTDNFKLLYSKFNNGCILDNVKTTGEALIGYSDTFRWQLCSGDEAYNKYMGKQKEEYEQEFKRQVEAEDK